MFFTINLHKLSYDTSYHDVMIISIMPITDVARKWLFLLAIFSCLLAVLELLQRVSYYVFAIVSSQ